MSDAMSVSQPSKRRMPAEEGIWVFIVGDMSIFGLFFVVFGYYYTQETELFLKSQATLNSNYGAFNTILLLSSSWFVVMALQAYRKQLLPLAGTFTKLAFLCGLGFASVKFVEYSEKISHGITLTTNDFYMFYYIYTGIHLLHVTIGMLVLVYLWSMTRKTEAPTAKDISAFEGGAVYWHMVDLLWIVLFPLLYLIR
jgi:nitric oxide reductase NorE protein